MANERKTDLIIYDMMKRVGLNPTPEKSDIIEVNEALKTASKKRTKKSGRPEYIAQVGKFLIVVEDKGDTRFQANYMSDQDLTLLMDIESVTDYAENGALHYAQHIAHNTSFKQVFAFGCSGTEADRMKIRPIYVSESGYRVMPQVRDFSDFTIERINTYYQEKVLQKKSEQQVELEAILSRANKLNEDMRNYGALGEQEKPIVVSGVVLALNSTDFRINMLTGDEAYTDGQKLYDAIESYLKDSDIPDYKKDIMLHQFGFIRLRRQLSAKHPALGKTPLRYFAEYIHSRVLSAICDNNPSDVLGQFYGEFLRYTTSDGKGLGIVLTPSHITNLMVELLDIDVNDKVLDPCCGTGGFLIAAMSDMYKKLEELPEGKEKRTLRKTIKKDLLHGIEMKDQMYSIASTNMILRGDGKSNLECTDFFSVPVETLKEQKFSVGLMNPPYSQAKNKQTAHLSELSFIKRLLDVLDYGAKCAVIVPQSTMVGKTRNDAQLKEAILNQHTLEGVITLNPQTFYGVGTNPVIAIFTANRPHPASKVCKFINFKEDGYEVAPHLGLLDNGSFKEKKEKLLDCWLNDASAHSSFMVKSKVESSDEWLHSFYYFNDEIPTDEDFEKTMADYLSFEFKMIAEGRGYLFGFDKE